MTDIDVEAMADAAVQQPALLGVVAPPTDDRPFEDTYRMAVQSLEQTRQRLRELRDRRAAINEEIKQLVADEELLGRMIRVRK